MYIFYQYEKTLPVNFDINEYQIHLNGFLKFRSEGERLAMSNYRFIVNPTSGRGAGELAVPEIRKYCNLQGIEYDIVRTERTQHAISLTRDAINEKKEVIVAVGGDGTANEVINGLMYEPNDSVNNPVMGILGVGRGNDFAYGLGIPSGITDGFDILIRNQYRPIDVGHVVGGLYPQGRYFGNGVGIGFDAVVGFEALKMTKLHGFLSYIIAAIKTIFLYYNAPMVRLEYNNETISLPALMISIMNGRRMGGGFLMAPHAEMDDGILNLCIAGEVSKAKIFYLILHFMKGTQDSQKEIRTAKIKDLKVTAIEGSLPTHADGETICVDGSNLNVKLISRAINVIC